VYIPNIKNRAVDLYFGTKYCDSIIITGNGFNNLIFTINYYL